MPRTNMRGLLLVMCDSIPIAFPGGPPSPAPRLVAGDGLAPQDQIRPQLRPLLVLVERNGWIDGLERKVVEVRIDGAARRHAVPRLEDRLPVARQHEVGEQ